jgi:hypothetical protein
MAPASSFKMMMILVVPVVKHDGGSPIKHMDSALLLMEVI